MSADELHEALRQLGAAMRAPTITGLRGGESRAAALMPQPYSHAAAPAAPATAPAATTTASANTPAPATARAPAPAPVAVAVPSAPAQALVPPPDAGRTTGGDATGGRAPPPDELLPAERWLIENRPRLAAIAGQAFGGDVGGDVGGVLGGEVGGVLGGGVGMPSPPLGYRAPPYPTVTADGLARPSLGPSYLGPSYLEPSYLGPSYLGPSYLGPSYLGPSYLEPSYHDPSYPGPSYHEQPWHHPREGWALDPSSQPAWALDPSIEPAAQLDALRDRISSLISAATTAVHTTTAATTTAAAIHAAGAPPQSQPSAPPAAAPPAAAPLVPPAETYPPSGWYGPAAAELPMGLADLARQDGAHPPRPTAGWAFAPDAPPPELRPYGAESRRLAPALAGPRYDVGYDGGYDMPSYGAPPGHHHRGGGGGGGMTGAPFGPWSHLSDAGLHGLSVTTSSDVARERLRHDVQVRGRGGVGVRVSTMCRYGHTPVTTPTRL